MPRIDKENISAIRDWLAGLGNYSQNFGDLMLKKFLHSCYYDLDKMKTCIEKFCTYRYNMPEVFMDRDPFSAKIKTAFSITNVSAFRADDKEFLIYSLDDPTLEKFKYYDILKAFTLQADYYLMTSEFLPEIHYFFFDLQFVSFRIIPKLNVFHFRKFITCLLESMPVRLKQIHIINCPSYIDKLYALIKPCLPQNIRNIIYFHLNLESLHSSIGTKYLPKELGGDTGSLKEAHKQMVKEIQSPCFRNVFQDDAMWKADFNKKIRTPNSLNTDFKRL